MSGLREFLELVADDARMAWHQWRRDAHARGLADAERRHRDRIVAWTGHAPADPADGREP